jgi:glutamate formiminotransferase/formiminotetrahydrofolate cyclodeaminase
MVHQLVECVPNISEGRKADVLDRVAGSLRAIEGVRLLGVEPDRDYNRTVITFVGPPREVLEGALALTRTALAEIDMRGHSGEHPRLGAVDVVPFVPIRGVSMQDCVALAREYARQAAREHDLPVYLYEAAASSPKRRNLADIRKGEYEGLPQKLQDPSWKPDEGPAVFQPRSGAVIAGARKFLIAYNVNLNTADTSIAHEIALRIRESGRVQKDEQGNTVRNGKGEPVKIPGTLKAVKAMGVLLERHQIAQVSINLVDYETTPPHVAFEEVKAQARSLGVDATGGEIIGLTPLEALVVAGRHYSPPGGAVLPEEELLRLAVEHLGLSQLEPFNPRTKIIEYMIA